MPDELSILQLWEWAIENSPNEYIVWVALAVVVGIAFRVVKPVFDWIALHIGMIFRFLAERADKRREFRRNNKLPNRT